MKRSFIIGSLGLLAVLAACSRAPTTTPDQNGNDQSSSADIVSSSSDQSSSARQFSYRGIIKAADTSVSTDVSYVLALPDASVLLLQTSDKNLDEYIDRQVQLTGTLSVASDGAKMLDVTGVFLVEQTSSTDSTVSSSAASLYSSSAPAQASSSSVAPPSSSSKSSVAQSSVSNNQQSSAATSGVTYSVEMQARIQKMAKDKGPSAWTQQYCSSHIGVCFPVRSDYWYHSFGATTSTLWHVEMNSEDITVLGDGPISVDLVSGRLSSDNLDQTVQTQDGVSIGYRAWTDNRHFEVKGPAQLQPAIEYITQNIIPYAPAGQ